MIGVGGGKDETEGVFEDSSGPATLKWSGRQRSSRGTDFSCDLRRSKNILIDLEDVAPAGSIS